jgi:PadR family transcriptional regulator PadR
VRRRPGQLLDLEVQILAAMVQHAAVEPELHGFGLAKLLADGRGSTRLTSHGTLYKALGRLEAARLLSSRWEDSAIAEEAGRPRRRLYQVTGSGRAALAAHDATEAETNVAPVGRLGIEWR